MMLGIDDTSSPPLCPCFSTVSRLDVGVRRDGGRDFARSAVLTTTAAAYKMQIMPSRPFCVNIRLQPRQRFGT